MATSDKFRAELCHSARTLCLERGHSKRNYSGNKFREGWATLPAHLSSNRVITAHMTFSHILARNGAWAYASGLSGQVIYRSSIERKLCALPSHQIVARRKTSPFKDASDSPASRIESLFFRAAQPAEGVYAS